MVRMIHIVLSTSLILNIFLFSACRIMTPVPVMEQQETAANVVGTTPKIENAVVAIVSARPGDVPRAGVVEATSTTLRPKREWVQADKITSPPTDWIDGMADNGHFPRVSKGGKGHGYSQLFQDTFLEYIFDSVGVTNKFYVEFGYYPATWVNSQGNSNWLNNVGGWNGLIMDGSNDNPVMNLHMHKLTSSNIVSLFQKYKVPKELDYLSVDMDSWDQFVLRAILKGGFRPRVISTEYNINWGMDLPFVYEDPTLHNRTMSDRPIEFMGCVWGVSMKASKLLAAEFGYTLVSRVERLDLFWIRDDILKKHKSKVPTWESLAPPPSALHFPSSVEDVKKVMDYEVYVETGSIELAKDAALKTMVEKIRNHQCVKKALDEMGL